MVDQEKIHNQTLSDDPEERIYALDELCISFSSMPDKQQAWNDLHRLTNDEDFKVRYRAANALDSAFSQVPDKQQAWNDLLRLTDDKVSWVRYSAASALVSSFSQVPDKQQAWNDLNRLINYKYTDRRYSAASALRSAFSQVPDKQQAWDDLHRLTNDEDSKVRSRAAYALVFAFSQVPIKQQAWDDLHRLTNDEDSKVRYSAVSALGSAFSKVPDKQQAWDDLHRLTNDEDSDVRSRAAVTLGSAFSKVPDKQRAWDDLHRLTNDEDSKVRYSAVSALGSAFSQVPDKQWAWDDLHRLTNDEDSNVRYSAADALSSAFSQIPEKQQAWNDLHRLTSDEFSFVRASSNHSLGRISIFKASHAETDEDYKTELEKAIEYFEIAAKEPSPNNPAKFCLPFYCSFHTIVFKKQEAKEEVNKYLEEAKAAVEGSESKKHLLEAVENLSEALKEVQNLEKLDLQRMKGELNFYRTYCDRAAELMKDTDEKAPLATKVLRKGLPILDRKLRGILEDIQEKAKNACQVSQGTEAEQIACAINKEIQQWEICSQEEMTKKVEDVAYMLQTKVADLPKNKHILNKIEALRNERDLVKQFDILLYVLGIIQTVKVVPEDKVIENINKVSQSIETKLDCISVEMNEIRISLGTGLKQEIEISSGIEAFGTGAKLVTTISLQEISYAELKEDLQRIKGEHINKLSQLPKRLANKIKGYLLLNDREDIIERLT